MTTPFLALIPRIREGSTKSGLSVADSLESVVDLLKTTLLGEVGEREEMRHFLIL